MNTPFAYGQSSSFSLNAGNMPGHDGYSPQRDELAELIRRLRCRYGRRRVFRTTDVEGIIREMRWPHQLEFLERRRIVWPVPTGDEPTQDYNVQ